MTQQTYLTDEVKALIGKVVETKVLDIDRTIIRYFAHAVGCKDPIFLDEDYARQQGYRSLVAPPGIPAALIFQYEPLTSISYAVAGPTRFLNGGNDVEYYDTICAGDTLTAATRITDISERAGSLGLTVYVIRETTYTNQDGKVVAKAHGTLIQY